MLESAALVFTDTFCSLPPSDHMSSVKRLEPQSHNCHSCTRHVSTVWTPHKQRTRSVWASKEINAHWVWHSCSGSGHKENVEVVKKENMFLRKITKPDRKRGPTWLHYVLNIFGIFFKHFPWPFYSNIYVFSELAIKATYTSLYASLIVYAR